MNVNRGNEARGISKHRDDSVSDPCFRVVECKSLRPHRIAVEKVHVDDSGIPKLFLNREMDLRMVVRDVILFRGCTHFCTRTLESCVLFFQSLFHSFFHYSTLSLSLSVWLRRIKSSFSTQSHCVSSSCILFLFLRLKLNQRQCD